MPSSAKVRPAVLAWRVMYAAQLLQKAGCWEQRRSLLKCFDICWVQVVLLGNRHSSSSNTKPLHMHASLAPLSSKAADGFIMHPSVLQAATTSCSSSSRVPAGIEAVCLPTAATAVGAASWSAGGGAASLVAARSGSLAATLHGMQWCAAQQLEPSLAASAQAIDLSDLVYQVEWQAADSLAGVAASAAIGQPQLALVSGSSSRGSARQLAALQLCQTASVAAADAVQLLHSHRSSQLKTVSLHTTGSLPAQHQLAPAQPAVGAAAIAGVMKNLPYEMPFMSSQLLDTEASSSSSGAGSRAYAMSATPLAASLQADLYGVAARGGALHRPLLMYAAAGAGADSSSPAGEQATAPVEGSSTYAITGGLGGLGMLTANWLAGSGARSLVLLSRSGQAASAGDAAAILHSPALVVVSKCDVSFSEDARLLAATTRAQSHRFGGIVHTAGLQVSAGFPGAGLGCAGLPPLSLPGTASAPRICLLQLWRLLSPFLACAHQTMPHPSHPPLGPLQVEARLPQQTLRTLRQAMAPKLGAVQNCLDAAPADPLAFSLLFSSVSSIAGFSGHANYSAANAALDAFAHQQAATGMRMAAVQWGAWTSVGEWRLLVLASRWWSL
jgi:hypothetical protein